MQVHTGRGSAAADGHWDHSPAAQAQRRLQPALEVVLGIASHVAGVHDVMGPAVPADRAVPAPAHATAARQVRSTVPMKSWGSARPLG